MCGCKHGKATKLNNLDSKDHLKLASETYLNIILPKSLEEYDEFDKHQIFTVYSSLYPNQKMKPTLDQSITQIKLAHERFIQK
jgi:hypothetical protein